MEKETKAAFSKLIIQTINRRLVEPKQQKVRRSHKTSSTTRLDSEAESEHIRQRKALGRKSNICNERIWKICTKFGTSDEQKKETKFTVYDALNDGSSVRLGMGDFVFYSLLVGKAAATRSTMCVAGSVVGILVGLVITLTVLSSDDETTPALPVSITIALLLHFGIYLFVEPFYSQIVMSSKLFILL
uniref:Presenilin spe-4, putative n=2 Tax=Brugia TaxID=6278 RepID=A8PM37_BRUMA